MKYKEGDVVVIKSLKWYNKNKDFDDCISRQGQHCFTSEMKQYCGMRAQVTAAHSDFYLLDIAGDEWVFQDYMLDDLKTMRKMKLKKLQTV